MGTSTNDVVARRLSRQYGVISRAQALAAGMSSQQVARRVTTGTWKRLHPGVYRLAGSPFTPHARLLAACLATNGTASHQSAGWLWGLLAEPPAHPTVTVPRSSRHRRPGIVVHRSEDRRARTKATLYTIPCTDPYRTVVDLAAVVDRPHLDGAIDGGLAKRLITVDGLVTEIQRRTRQGQRGVILLRSTLSRRGYIGAPAPSVLESMVLRLLAEGGIEPCGVEVEVQAESDRYRLDITLADLLAMEVDGYAYHADPDSMTRDYRRRNDLIGLGWTVLVFTWLDITRDPRRVLDTVRAALHDTTTNAAMHKTSKTSKASKASKKAIEGRPS